MKPLRIFFILAICLLLIGANIQTQVHAVAPANTGWMFNGGSWSNPSATYPNGTNNWRVVDGSPFHYGSDFYGQDWNWGAGDADSGKEVKTPIGGNVIWAGNAKNGYGNSVVIRWDTDGNFAWRAAHLATIKVKKGDRIYTGHVIGTIGNTTGTSDTTPYHLHSAFYKNITQNDGSVTALSKLRNGQSLGSTSLNTQPDKFAYSQCEKVTATNVILYSSTQCTGISKKFSLPGLYNLSSHSFNDVTKSLNIPQGLSVKLYTDSDRGGASKCFGTGKYQNLQREFYTNGTRIVPQDIGSGLGTVSSVEIFNNANCAVDGMTFDKHVNYPNGSNVAVGTQFNKIWRLKNTGTTTWTTSYRVSYVNGDQLNGPSYINLPSSVAPGATIDVSVSLKASSNMGTKTANWALKNSSGSNVGSPFQVNINVVSACTGYNSNNIVLFTDKECMGTTRSFSSVGFRNLSEYSFSEVTSSIHVPSGMSVRVYEHANKGGSSRCVFGSMYNLSVDYYTNGNTNLIINDTISSIDVFNNTNCAPASNCPNVSATGVIPFSDYECKGSAPYQYPAGGWWNLDTLNNNTRSLYVPAGKSVRLYEGNNRSGWTKCVSTTLYDLRKDYYSATSVPLVNSSGGANLSSIEVFNNNSCSPVNTGCSNYSSSSVVLFADANCAGDRRYFSSNGFSNVPELDFNDKASSIFIPNGMSIKVYEHDNGNGSWSCYNTVGGLWDLSKDWYQHGNTNLRLNDTISSIRVYSNRNCQ